MLDRIKNFFGGVRYELKNVHWPTRSEAIRLTVIIIIASILVAIFLGAFDFLFTYLLKIFVVN